MKEKIVKIQEQTHTADEEHVTARQMYKTKEPFREKKRKIRSIVLGHQPLIIGTWKRWKLHYGA